MKKTFYIFIILVVALSIGINLYMSHVFLTYSDEDFMNAPLLNGLLVLFAFSILKNLLLSIYFVMKRYWLILVCNALVPVFYLNYIFLYYKTYADQESDDKVFLSYLDGMQFYSDAGFWAVIALGTACIISKLRKDAWLKVYGAFVIVSEITTEMLEGTRRYIALEELDYYLSCLIPLFIIMQVIADLRKIRIEDDEILDQRVK